MKVVRIDPNKLIEALSDMAVQLFEKAMRDDVSRDQAERAMIVGDVLLALGKSLLAARVDK